MSLHDGPPEEGRHVERYDGGHPTADELRRQADGALDPERDAALIRHVATCAVCRAEVERLRRASAAAALSSAPPPDLLERIRARRAAGERVQLPVDELATAYGRGWEDEVTVPRDGHPALVDVHRVADGEYESGSDALLIAHVRGCEECTREVEGVRRVTAALSLTSAAPGDLFQRIATRRASGERVILPLDGRVTREARRRIAWRFPRRELAMAATLLLAVGIGRAAWKRAQPGVPGQSTTPIDSSTTPPPPTIAAGKPDSTRSTSPVSGRVDSALSSLPTATTFRSAGDSAERLWLTLDAGTRRARWRETTRAILRLNGAVLTVGSLSSEPDSTTVGLRDSAFDGAALTPAARARTGELAKILVRRPEYRVRLVGYDVRVTRDSAPGPLVGRVSAVRDALVSAGMPADRIAVAPVSPPAGEGAGPPQGQVEIRILAPKRAPEIR